MRIVVATGNEDKMNDYRNIFHRYLGEEVEVISQKDAGVMGECEEDGKDYVDNAYAKLFFVRDLLYPSFEYDLIVADDSGLEVGLLDGFPGLYSKRWIEGTNTDKCKSLLKKIAEVPIEKRTQTLFLPVDAYKIAMVAIDRNGHCYRNDAKTEGFVMQPENDATIEGVGYDAVFYIPKAKCFANKLSEDTLFEHGYRHKAGKNLCDTIKEMGL